MPYEGREPYVDPGTEPEETGAEEVDEGEALEGDPDFEEPTDEPTDETESEEADDTEEVEAPAAELPEAARQALAFANHVGTPEGAIDFFIEAGLGMGKTVDEMEAFLMGAGAPADDEDEDDDERVMTVKEWKAAQKEISQQTRAEREAEEQARATAQIQSIVSEVMPTFKLGDEELSPRQRRTVLNNADDYLDEDSQWDPKAVREAMAKGFADFVADSGFSVEGKKVIKRKVVPKGIKGSTGGAATPVEPQTVAEGIARARKQLKAAGAFEV